MSLIGYARVSSVGQSLDAQVSRLQDIHCEQIFQEKRSGVDRERPELKACFRYLRKGDILAITRIDRLARSPGHLHQLMDKLVEMEVALKVIDQAIDTRTATGKAFLGMLAVFAEFETEIRRERQMDGIKKARENGIKFGRKPLLTEKQEEEIIRLRSEGLSLQNIADLFGVSKGLIHKISSRN